MSSLTGPSSSQRSPLRMQETRKTGSQERGKNVYDDNRFLPAWWGHRARRNSVIEGVNVPDVSQKSKICFSPVPYIEQSKGVYKKINRKA